MSYLEPAPENLDAELDRMEAEHKGQIWIATGDGGRPVLKCYKAGCNWEVEIRGSTVEEIVRIQDNHLRNYRTT